MWFPGEMAARLTTAATVLVGAVLTSAVPAHGQTTTTTTTDPSPAIDLTGRSAGWFVGALTIGIVVAWTFVLISDRRRAYRAEQNRLDAFRSLLGASMPDPVRTEALKALGGSALPGGSLTATLLALLTLTLVAFGFAGVLVSAATDAVDLRKTIATSLLSVLATIAGFYFGAKTAQGGTTTETDTGDGGTASSVTRMSLE